MSSPRLPWTDIAPKTYQAMAGVKASYARASTLGKILMSLMDLRVSQINGCAFCVDMHTRELRHHGEAWQRINSLCTWRETALYSPRERAALGWTESLTLIAGTGAPDEDYEAVKREFSEAEQVNLTMLIGAINAWNRFAIGLRAAHPKEAARVAAA